jgi:hypothetical protein
LLAGAIAAGTGCDRETARVEEQRRELLEPVDHVQKRAERQERERIFDDEGVPLESDQSLAGFPMPRGFVVTRESGSEWYLESRVVNAEAAARYVEKRVLTERISRDGSGGVSFDLVALRSDPKAPKRRITVTAISGMPSASEIFLSKPDLSPEPPKPRPSFAQTQAIMEAQRKHAD